ncbi:hypothetical protein [Roseivirga thermotolerans]|uniref:hypothetical protein n=2 Tax=Roseivirga thermotolerans TaxID=1758176 RepID=UPI00273D6503|nr:hypothetical protein [Roseivirga thermotolerans]
MRTYLKKGMAIIVMASLYACANDDSELAPQKTPASISFVQNLSVSEGSGENIISLKLDKPAGEASTVKVQVTNSQEAAFTTVPATINNQIELNIDKGATETQIVFKPTNDELVNADRTIGFTLLSATNGLQLGSKSSIQVSISDDDQANTQPTVLNFEVSVAKVEESQSAIVKILFSERATQNGKLTLELEQLLATQQFSTTPAMSGTGTLELIIAQGQTEASFEVSVADDALFNRHDQVMFTITQVEGNFAIGEKRSTKLELIDNELKGMAKSFTSSAGNFSSTKTYEYDQQGRVSKVYWERGSHQPLRGVDTYTYAANGLIEKINQYPGIDEMFYQTNGRITRSEVINHGVVKSYRVYDYDQAGNVAGFAEYTLQSNGTYLQSIIMLYLYHENGNLYAHLTYSPGQGSEDPTLISERYYEHYLNVSNKFSAVEVIPTINAQRNLPSSFRMVENGHDLSYSISYEFDNEGKATKRLARSGQAMETVNYTYY